MNLDRYPHSHNMNCLVAHIICIGHLCGISDESDEKENAADLVLHLFKYFALMRNKSLS